ncbi:APOM protein, partial [Atractosteus spatula]|nr:APOM protein [Atractosteus spatula]
MAVDSSVWACLAYLAGLALQALWPCRGPQQMSAGSLNTAEYFGTWYFIAAAGENSSDLQTFTLMDNAIFSLQGAELPQRLLLQGVFRVGEYCGNKTWIYYIHPGRDDLEQEGRPERTVNIYRLDCRDCILLQESSPGSNRVMLYGRSASPGAQQVQDFQRAAACMGLTHFLRLPQQAEYCTLESAP